MRIASVPLLCLVLALAACSSTSGGGGRSTSDPRVRTFVGAQLPPGGGGTWLRPMAQQAPGVIFYQFAFPG